MKPWLLISLLAAFAQADSPKKIDLPPGQQGTEETAPVPASAQEPISTTVKDPKDKHWKEYDNRIVKAHVHIHERWTVMEIKETQTIGSVSFTVARELGLLATFSITRGPLGGPFESWISSDSLKPLYPNGYRSSSSSLAGRQATLIKGMAADGRYDESFFIAHGGDIYQVSCTAPKESWKQYEPAFTAVKQSLRWLP